MVRPRTWSDEQLTQAVTGAKSWRQACAALEIKQGGATAQRIRAHAARIGVDTSHLDSRVRTEVSPALITPTGVTIRPDALREATMGARSWAEVNRRLGLPEASGGAYKRIQRLAADAGIDTSHMLGKNWNRVPVKALPVPFASEYDPANLHRVGAAVATAWFIARGYMVSLPVEPARYDLIAESDAGLQRVQVKTGSNSSRVHITRAAYGAGKMHPSTGKYGRRPYEPGEIDLFFIYLAMGAKYLIPLSAVQGLRTLALARYADYRLPD
jgi:hypothetical protein